MKRNSFLANIPEIEGYAGRTRREILKAADRLLKQDDPWFVPAVMWMSAIAAGTLYFLVILLCQLLAPDMDRSVAVMIGFASMIPPAVITAFAQSHVAIARLRPYVSKARRDFEARQQPS